MSNTKPLPSANSNADNDAYTPESTHRNKAKGKVQTVRWSKGMDDTVDPRRPDPDTTGK